eukprot:m.111107 g.111107  ORF g.111107 m.111107 type:complete len:153 (+) comp16991_c0_seq2:330-788(+)
MPQQRKVCLCAGDGRGDYEGEWHVPPALRVMVACGSLTMDFRRATWETDVVNLKVRTAFGHITLIIPDEGIKVDTTCAGCCTGWVWCGGYMGDADAERSIVLCEYAWFGLISVVKASAYERDNPDANERGNAYVADEQNAASPPPANREQAL